MEEHALVTDVIPIHAPVHVDTPVPIVRHTLVLVPAIRVKMVLLAQRLAAIPSLAPVRVDTPERTVKYLPVHAQTIHA